MTPQDVQSWLDRYVAAWVACDPTASGRDEPGTYEARYQPWAVAPGYPRRDGAHDPRRR